MNQLLGTKDDGTPFLMLVLEPANMHRIKEGSPARVRIDDWFPDGIPSKLEVLVGYSETPLADARELKKVSGMTFDERTARSKEKRPHCPECISTIEDLGIANYPAAAVPLKMVFCPTCGCILGLQIGEKS